MAKSNFEKYLLNEKRFINKNYRSDVEFLKTHGYEIDSKKKRSHTAKINSVKKRYASVLADKFEDISKASLADIEKEANLRGIQIVLNAPRSYDDSEWRKHEIAVREGLNELFQLGVFRVVRKNGNTTVVKDLKNKKFAAVEVGGAVDSDVKVQNDSNGKSFFVECKLNYDSAGYFKYGLKIHDDQLAYDHSKYLQGKDKSEKENINQLFSNDVNLTKFLTKLVHNDQLLKHWKEFHRRALEVKDFILGNEEFRDFAAKVKFKDVWPDDFKKFVEVFDIYCDYYISKYNALMERLFQTFDSSSLDVADYTITDSSRAAAQKSTASGSYKNAAFQTLDSLRKTVEENQLQIRDEKKFGQLVHMMVEIEAKFMALLSNKRLMQEHSINDIKTLKNNEKTRAFYKMFISASGRKSKDGTYDLMAEDQLGNMVVCPVFKLTDDEMAKLITNFYVKKDHCAYIQIGRTIYQFDKAFNPLNIPDLPIFQDHLQNFEIWIGMDDSMNKINLHVRAKEPAEETMGSTKILSFKTQDQNFLPNVVKEIEIDVSK